MTTLQNDWRLLVPAKLMYDRFPLYRIKVGERNAVVILPQGNVFELPWIAYHTGAGETCEAITGEGLVEKPPIIKRLLEAGFLVCTITSGEQHWGDPSAEAAHEELYQFIRLTFPVREQVNLLVQSMGDTSGYTWANQHPERVQRIYGIYPVTCRPEMGTRNPVQNLASLAQHHIRIRHRHGLEDESVPFQQNARKFTDVYRQLDGEIELVSLPELGHEVHERLFVPEDVVEFFQRPISQ